MKKLVEILVGFRRRLLFNYDWAMFEEYGEITEDNDGILRITKFNNGGKL